MGTNLNDAGLQLTPTSVISWNAENRIAFMNEIVVDPDTNVETPVQYINTTVGGKVYSMSSEMFRVTGSIHLDEGAQIYIGDPTDANTRIVTRQELNQQVLNENFPVQQIATQVVTENNVTTGENMHIRISHTTVVGEDGYITVSIPVPTIVNSDLWYIRYVYFEHPSMKYKLRLGSKTFGFIVQEKYNNNNVEIIWNGERWIETPFVFPFDSLRVANGSDATPGLSFLGTTTSGIYLLENNADVGVSVGGQHRLVVRDGRVDVSDGDLHIIPKSSLGIEGTLYGTLHLNDNVNITGMKTVGLEGPEETMLFRVNASTQNDPPLVISNGKIDINTNLIIKSNLIIDQPGTVSMPTFSSITGDISGILTAGIVTVSQVRMISSGTFESPVFTWNDDPSSGIYRSVVNISTVRIGISTQGQTRAVFDEDGLELKGNLRPTGILSVEPSTHMAPRIHIKDVTGLGMFAYVNAEDTEQRIGFATGGVARIVVSPRGADITGDVHVSQRLFTTNGTVGNPAISFVSKKNTGMYVIEGESGDLGFSVNGSRILQISPTGIDVNSSTNTIRGIVHINDLVNSGSVTPGRITLPFGSVLNPCISVGHGQTTTIGFHRTTTNGLGISVGTTVVGTFTSTGLTITGSTRVSERYKFANAEGTSIYSGSPNELTLQVQSKDALRITSTHMTLDGRMTVSDGTVLEPAYTFNEKLGYGFFAETNAIGVSVAGSRMATINEAGIFIDKLISAERARTSVGTRLSPAYTFDDRLTTGIFSEAVGDVSISCSESVIGKFNVSGLIVNGRTASEQYVFNANDSCSIDCSATGEIDIVGVPGILVNISEAGLNVSVGNHIVADGFVRANEYRFNVAGDADTRVVSSVAGEVRIACKTTEITKFTESSVDILGDVVLTKTGALFTSSADKTTGITYPSIGACTITCSGASVGTFNAQGQTIVGRLSITQNPFYPWTATNPTFAFGNVQGTGIYLNVLEQTMCISTSNTNRFVVSQNGTISIPLGTLLLNGEQAATRLNIADELVAGNAYVAAMGTPSVPGITFKEEPATGIYCTKENINTTSVSIAVIGETNVATFTRDGIDVKSRVVVPKLSLVQGDFVRIQHETGGDMTFHTNDETRLTINANGNIHAPAGTLFLGNVEVATHEFANSRLTTGREFTSGHGTNAQPGIHFLSAANTGIMYDSALKHIGIVAESTRIADVSLTGVRINHGNLRVSEIFLNTLMGSYVSSSVTDGRIDIGTSLTTRLTIDAAGNINVPQTATLKINQVNASTVDDIAEAIGDGINHFRAINGTNQGVAYRFKDALAETGIYYAPLENEVRLTVGGNDTVIVRGTELFVPDLLAPIIRSTIITVPNISAPTISNIKISTETVNNSVQFGYGETVVADVTGDFLNVHGTMNSVDFTLNESNVKIFSDVLNGIEFGIRRNDINQTLVMEIKTNGILNIPGEMTIDGVVAATMDDVMEWTVINKVVPATSGSAMTPSITFYNNLASGLFNTEANHLGISSLNTHISTFTPLGQNIMGTLDVSGYITMNGKTVATIQDMQSVSTTNKIITIADGSSLTPAMTFNSDKKTGLYKFGEGTGQIGFTVNSVTKAVINQQGLDVSGNISTNTHVRSMPGTETAPAFTFTNNTTTGVYVPSVGSLGITTQGINRATFSSTGLHVVGSVTQTSDERLKTEIKTITGALERVMSLRGITYDLDGNRRTGLIAQDVQKVMPEAVRTDENGYLSVAYGELMGLLVEAVKDLARNRI